MLSQFRFHIRFASTAIFQHVRQRPWLLSTLIGFIALSAMPLPAYGDLGEAIASRFNERLATAKKAEIDKILRQSGQNKLANYAPALSAKIFQAINLGVADHDAVRNAVVDSLS